MQRLHVAVPLRDLAVPRLDLAVLAREQHVLELRHAPHLAAALAPDPPEGGAEDEGQRGAAPEERVRVGRERLGGRCVRRRRGRWGRGRIDGVVALGGEARLALAAVENGRVAARVAHVAAIIRALVPRAVALGERHDIACGKALPAHDEDEAPKHGG